jgi:hypothetical protein
MLRPLALTLLILLAACASHERPPEAVGPVETAAPAPQVDTPSVEPVEPLDPNIHPLSREMEDAGAR